MSVELIVNADDFGRSAEINRAVIRAHREGILTSASLMIAGSAAQEAIELARENPSLAVGLHLTVVDGSAVLPPRRIPHLVDDSGHFPNAPVRLGLRYAFNQVARRELAEEIAAQFDRFMVGGLALSHVDGHQHLHLHPVVFDLMLPLAKKYGARRIRIVRDDLRLALNYDRSRAAGKTISAGVFAALGRRARRCQLAGPPWTYGFYQSGQMTERYVLSIIEQMQQSAEIYFHPTDGPRLDDLGPNPGDLETLISAAVRGAIAARGLLREEASTPKGPAADASYPSHGGRHRMPAGAK